MNDWTAEVTQYNLISPLIVDGEASLCLCYVPRRAKQRMSDGELESCASLVHNILSLSLSLCIELQEGRKEGRRDGKHQHMLALRATCPYHTEAQF